MSKKTKSTPVPPTVLVITLEADGNGSLLARRGELAHLSQFTYRGIQEIIAAIQSGAVALGELEQNPPTVEITPAEPVTDTPPAPDAETEAEPQTAVDEQVIEPEPVTIEADSQAKLF